jgi:hypothetical protein
VNSYYSGAYTCTKNIDHICVTTELTCFGNCCDNQNDNKIK